MSNVVNIANAETNELDAIAARIAERAAKTVENVWHIGDELNRAKALCGTDQEFGAWRRDSITSKLGIADRTQRTFMRIASTWTKDQLPQFLGITALADVASLPEVQRNEALTYLTQAAVEGKRVPVGTATTVVQEVRKGVSGADLYQRFEPAAMLGVEDVEPIAPPARERPEAPVTIDGETGEVEQEPRQPAIPAPQACPSVEWAKQVVRALKRQNGHRAEYLGALKAELTAAGMLEVVEGTAAVISEGRKSRIEIRGGGK